MQPVSASPRTVLHLKFRIVKKKNNNKTKYRQYKNLHSCPGGVRFVRAEVKSENEKNNVKAWASSRWAFDTHIINIIFTVVFSSDDPADPRSGSADLRAPIPDRCAVVGRPTVLLLRYTYPPLNQLVIIRTRLYNNNITYDYIIPCTRDRVQAQRV